MELTFERDVRPVVAACEKRLGQGRGVRAVLHGGEAGDRVFLAYSIANARGKEVLIVDLAAAKGAQAKKHLHAVFRRARAEDLVLLFEEADALFRRRTEVARKAQSYLLGALRRFRGLAIVSMDSALGKLPKLVGVADVGVACGPGQSGADEASDRPLTTLHFRVLVGERDLGLCEVSRMTSVSEVVLRRAPKSDKSKLVRQLPGPATYRSVTLKRGATRSKELFLWRESIVRGRRDRRDVTIQQLHAPGGAPVNSWKLFGCWPRCWTGPGFDAVDGGVAMEEVELCFDRGCPPDAGPSWERSDPVAVFRERPYGRFNFLVDIGGGDDVGSIQAGFMEVSGLRLETSVVEYRAGNSPINSPIKLTGISRVPNVTLRRGLIGSLDLWQWMQEVKDGSQNALRTVSIALQSEDHTGIVQVWILKNARPVRYRGPDLNAVASDVAIEEFVLASEDITVE
ncbi:MAG: phage tail protein [Planctomycetota bacterium]